MNQLKGKTKLRKGDKYSKVITYNLKNKTCDYGCGKEAKYYFNTADAYCCEDNFRRCSHQRKLSKLQAKLRYAGSKKQIMLGRIERGEVKCCYCGNTAKHLISNNRGCCEKYAKLCPSYSKVIGDKIRQTYIDDPDKHKRMSRAMLEAQNRKEVIEKKRKSMELLHNGDCIPCKEFQHNYEKGRKKFKNKHDRRITKELKELGIVPPDTYEERSTLLKKLKAKRR